MGWWSASILGGDTPLDFLGDFADLMGVDSESEDGLDELYGYNFTSDTLNKTANINKLIAYADKRKYPEYISIAYQVMAVILLATGSNISKDLKKTLIKHIKQDEWYKSKNPERVAYIDQLVGAIELYKNGLPIILKSEGLFEKIAEHVSSGKTGLANK